MKRNIKFAIDNIQKIHLEDYSEDEFAIARMGFLSTRPNSHELNISEDVLRQSAPSVLGKWVVADMTAIIDAGTHTDNQTIVGRVPENQTVEFVKDDDGYLRAYVDTIISKVYARDYCAMFEGDNDRAVSVEMMVETSEEDENKVLSFRIVGVTTLGHAIRPSCPQSNITFTRFSEEDANAFFNKVHKNSLTALEQFAESRKKLMAESKSYKIDKSKEAMSEKAWGDVDKTELRNKIMEAKNRSTLVKAVYMLVEDGWEDAPSEHLKYPVMCFEGDTLVYNKGGLASALGYAKKEEETAVVNKINKIYKNLGLDQDGKEDAKMSEIDFEEKVEAQEEMAETEQEMECKKLEDSCDCKDENGDEDKDENEDEEVEMSADEMKAEMARLQSEIESRENIIMEKDTKMGEMEKELSELREYKAACEKKELATSVESIMSEVKDCMAEEDYKRFRDEGLTCKMSELDAWSNKVKAFCFENGKVGKASKKNDGIFSFAAPVEHTAQKPTDVWERLKNL